MWYEKPVWSYVLVILLAALPLFAHLDDLPVQLYDEQRLATNSLESTSPETSL